MSNLRKGFFPAPKNQEAGAQQQCQETNKPSKINTATTPASEEKPRKQFKSILYQEVSEFNPTGQMSIDQLVRVVLNLQEEVKKLRKENEKLTEQIQHGLQDTLDLRMANQERELTAL